MRSVARAFAARRLSGLHLAPQPKGDEPQQGEDATESEHDRHDEPESDDDDLQSRAEVVRDLAAPQECGHDHTGQRDGEPDRYRRGGIDVGDRDGDRDGERDDHGLHREDHGGDPVHVLLPSSIRASPAVTTDPVTRTPPPPSGASCSASPTATSMASGIVAAWYTLSSPKIWSASPTRSPSRIERGDEFSVATTRSTTGSSSLRMPSTSLSRSTATTPTRLPNVNSSVTVSAKACAPAGLCAASSSTGVPRRNTSRRPGDPTRAKAARTASASSASRPPPRNASTAATAHAAFWAWCAPCSGRNTSSYEPARLSSPSS